MNNAKRKPRAYIYTLGCRVNQYESAAVAAELEKYGFEIAENDADCDVYIINTCAVTAERNLANSSAMRQSKIPMPPSSSWVAIRR